MKQKTVIKLLLLPCLCLSLLACSNNGAKEATKKEDKSSLKEAAAVAPNQDKRAAFENIHLATAEKQFKDGTSLEELTNLFGKPISHESKPAGSVTLDVYTWKFDDITINANLYENSTIVKSIQNFVFNRDLKLSLKEYRKIKVGMTYNETTKILTEPDDYTQAISTDKKQLQAIWISGLKTKTPGANISLIFENDKLIEKTQKGLID